MKKYAEIVKLDVLKKDINGLLTISFKHALVTYRLQNIQLSNRRFQSDPNDGIWIGYTADHKQIAFSLAGISILYETDDPTEFVEKYFLELL